MKILSKIAVMSLFALSLVSCEDFGNSGYCGANKTGDNLRWELDEEGTLTISGEGKMANYYHSGYSAKWASKSKKDTIKKVIIEDGVTTIGKEAFYECSNITEIDIPDSVTEIGMYAFYGCSSLQEVNIPDNVTKIETYTFSHCSGLEKVVIPDGVTEIERCAFNICENLTEIEIPDSVEVIREFAFAGCKELKKVTIPETLTEFEKSVFKNTEFLNQYARKNQPLIVNNIVIDGSGCTGDKVVIPDGVTEIGPEAFALTEYYDYNSMTSVELPDSIRVIGAGAFAYCKDLAEINFPEGLKVIESGAFTGCGDMPFIVFLPESLEEIHSIGYAVTSLVVPNPDLDISCFNVSKAEWAKIYCTRGSKAQEYAEKMGYECIFLEEMQDVNEFFISNLYDFEY